MARRCWRTASLRNRRAAAAARAAPAAAAAGRPVRARRGVAVALVAWRAAPACRQKERLAREPQRALRGRSPSHRNPTHAMHIISGCNGRPQLTATAERAVVVARHCAILLSMHCAPEAAGRLWQRPGRPSDATHVRRRRRRKRAVQFVGGWVGEAQQDSGQTGILPVISSREPGTASLQMPRCCLIQPGAMKRFTSRREVNGSTLANEQAPGHAPRRQDSAHSRAWVA